MDSKKHIFFIKKNIKIRDYITRIFLIKNNKTIKYIYNLLIYIFLLLIFFFVSRVFIWYKIVNGNLNYVGILTILLAFILDTILFAKIISVRSNRRISFITYSDIVLWTKKLENHLIFLFLLWMIYISSLAVSTSQILYKDNLFNFLLAILFPTIIIFEFNFLIVKLYLFLIDDKFLTKGSNSIINEIRTIINEKKFRLIKFIKIFLMVLSFIVSFYYGTLLTEEINNILIGNSIRYNIFIISLIITSISFTFCIKIFHERFINYFNLRNVKIDLKNIFVLLFSYINIIYITKYLAIVLVSPSEDPLLILIHSMNDKYAVQSGISLKVQMEIDLLILLMGQFFLTLIFIIIVLIYNSIKNLSISEALKKGFNIEEFSKKKYKSHKIIKFIISKQIKNDTFIKFIGYIYYWYILLGGICIGILLLYYLFQDQISNTNIFFENFINGNPFKVPMYILPLYFLITLVLSDIFDECQKKHVYKITDFIDKIYLKIFFKFAILYSNIMFAGLILMGLLKIYYIIEKYGNITINPNIKIIEYAGVVIISILITDILSNKFKELISKEFDVKL